MKILDRFIERVTKKGVETVKEEAKKTVEEAINENDNLKALGMALVTGFAVYKAFNSGTHKESNFVVVPTNMFVIK